MAWSINVSSHDLRKNHFANTKLDNVTATNIQGHYRACVRNLDLRVQGSFLIRAYLAERDCVMCIDCSSEYHLNSTLIYLLIVFKIQTLVGNTALL